MTDTESRRKVSIRLRCHSPPGASSRGNDEDVAARANDVLQALVDDGRFARLPRGRIIKGKLGDLNVLRREASGKVVKFTLRKGVMCPAGHPEVANPEAPVKEWVFNILANRVGDEAGRWWSQCLICAKVDRHTQGWFYTYRPGERPARNRAAWVRSRWRRRDGPDVRGANNSGRGR
jgi:hypothetical protein